MANGLRLEITGLDMFKDADKVVYEAVKDCMDDIRDDLVTLASGLAPVKTGLLEGSAKVRRSYNNKKGCKFTITFSANNDGFDYAKWANDESYNLGEGSANKRPPKSRFATGELQVGTGYATNSVEASQAGWDKYIQENVQRRLEMSLRTNGRKRKKM